MTKIAIVGAAGRMGQTMTRCLCDGVVADQAELARLGYVTPSRLSQVMALLQLAPDLQEALLFLPPACRGRDPVTERDLRPIAAVADWGEQRGSGGS